MAEPQRTEAIRNLKPVVSSAIIILRTPSGYRAFESETRVMHRLNPAAALVMELADGSRSVSEILEILATLIGADKVDRCLKWIARSFETGMLRNNAGNEESASINAETVAEIASELRWNGDVVSAYWLQKHAAELEPDHAEHWYRLGELAHINGDRQVARDAYERYSKRHPEDAEVRHILIALNGGALPPRAPDECIDQIYRRFAEFYESNMCEELGYKAPDHLAAALTPYLESAKAEGVAVDLGCGTGLFGQKLRPHCHRLIGVDLSEAMLEKARERQIYDQLHCDELTGWLDGYRGEPFDVIACCDTLIYFGDLSEVIRLAMGCLKPGGFMGFTLEKSDHAPLELADSGRFRHHRHHIRTAADSAGAQVSKISEKVLRKEYGENVIGLISILRKAIS